ncbi:MAG: hypothetical protein BGO82_07805 [Devosia sp. 67-54]|nr:MAG: hypothetical protein BGO82_07805 [Devosia sp. 67-54]
MHTFLREACEVKPGVSVPRKRLFEAYELWCHEVGEESLHDAKSFGRALRDASGYAIGDDDEKGYRPRMADGTRPRHYVGVALKPEWAYGGL